MYLLIAGFAGCLFGSFVNALVWRFRQQERVGLKKGKKSSAHKVEYSIWRGRSMCPSCKHQLSGLDLIPVFSWVFLKGKCRYCKKAISWQYPLVEILSGLLFAISYIYWPLTLISALDFAIFIFWLLAVTVGLSLAIYDIKWMILPNKLVYALAGFSGVFIVLSAFNSGSLTVIANSIIGSVVFGGFFYLLYAVSGGKWIGGGDVRLGFVLGLLLGWQKALLCLTLASYLGTLVVVVLIIIKKYHKKMRIPFGPFLLLGAYIAMLWGQRFIDWYLGVSGL